ncbi:MAG TPA: GIY-YIG nuclease family protein [Trueperaceae bacterium]|nr:GIY-YIG nuclease family protein [Trueperaceae bacterium]
MPITARWRPLASLPAARGRDAMPGVYELADEDKQLVYIGQSARDVPNRIRQHFAKEGCVRDTVRYWRYEYSRVPQADEARLLAHYRAANDGAAPPCNRATPLERNTSRRFVERFGSSDD